MEWFRIRPSAALDWEIASRALRQRSAPPMERSVRQQSVSPLAWFASFIEPDNINKRCARMHAHRFCNVYTFLRFDPCTLGTQFCSDTAYLGWAKRGAIVAVRW